MFIAFSLHVSGNYVHIIRRKCRTDATPGICNCILMTGMQGWMKLHPLHTRTGVYTYDIFSWWWAHSWQKHVVKNNKHNKKRFAPSCVYLQRWKSGHDVGSKSIDIKHITVNVLNYRRRTDFVHFWTVGDVKMKFVTRCQEHMANWFLLNDQQAAEIAEAL